MGDITADVISTVCKVFQTAADSALSPTPEPEISLIILYPTHSECDATFLNQNARDIPCQADKLLREEGSW